MKPTPRTNAEIISTSKKTFAIVVSDNFARQLERELNNANDEITRLKEILAMQHFRKDKRCARDA